MKCAIIDIGSNTIRMIVCSVKDNSAEIIDDAREKSVLLDCVYDRMLNKRGIQSLCIALSAMKKICDRHKCDRIYAFATSSLRSIDNGAEVCAYVKEHTGVSIDIISGEREAIYDYEGLRYVKKTYSGAALDLGGGSCQLFRYDGGILQERISLPIGSLRMYHMFTAGEIPTYEEAEALYSYILEQLSAYPEYHLLRPAALYAMGGTARCAIQLYKILYHTPYTGQITAEQLKQMYTQLIDQGEKSADIIRTYFEDRVNSLIPGMATLCAICAYVGADTLEEARCGVREGYLMKEIVHMK